MTPPHLTLHRVETRGRAPRARSGVRPGFRGARREFFAVSPEGCEVRLTVPKACFVGKGPQDWMDCIIGDFVPMIVSPAGWRRLIDLQTERDRLRADNARLKRTRAGLKRQLTKLQREAGS